MTKKVALLICSRVLGGHELQSVELAADLARHLTVKVFVNQAEHAKLYASRGLEVETRAGELLGPGNLVSQVARGLSLRKRWLGFLEDYDAVIVCAGAVEAGVAAGIALRGRRRVDLYLPFLFDRAAVWGRLPGCAYNFVLTRFLHLFNRIITINRIQAGLLRRHVKAKIIVVRNKIRETHAGNQSVESPRLVYIGRLDTQKRVAELCDWLDSPRNPFCTLLVMGDGPDRPKLEALAATLQHLRVEFLGWLPPARQDDLLSPKDILILNSIIEGEPLVIREARQRGMRVMARSIDGVRGITRKSMRFTDRESLLALLECVPAEGSDMPQSWPRRDASERLAAIFGYASGI